MATTKSSDVGAVSETKEVDQDTSGLKLDKTGLPLIPQPSSRADDPLNWSRPVKIGICLQVSLLSLLGPMASAVINPAFVPLSKAFGLTPTQASYELTVFLMFAAVAPLSILPLANVFGRRPILLAGAAMAAAMNVAAAFCSTWTGLMVTRAFSGLGSGWSQALGPAVICDIFFMHERGFYMGILVLFLNNGVHIAPLIGGFIAQNIGWRACFSIPGYIQIGLFVITLFCLPETLYHRKEVQDSAPERSMLDLLLFRQRWPSKRVRLGDYLQPLIMLRYVAVTLPIVYYLTCNAYGSVLFATTGSVVFSTVYGFDTIRTGLMLSIPLFVGNVIGEAAAGWVIDRLIYLHAKRHNGERPPEARLSALWLALLLPIGIIIDGVCISHGSASSWVGPAFGMAIASVGFQIASTVIYAYCTDCYKPQSTELSALLNLRQLYSGVVSFYALPLAERIGFEYAWLVFAMINLALLVPVMVLRFKGEAIRSSTWQKPPIFHNDI